MEIVLFNYHYTCHRIEYEETLFHKSLKFMVEADEFFFDHVKIGMHFKILGKKYRLVRMTSYIHVHDDEKPNDPVAVSMELK